MYIFRVCSMLRRREVAGRGGVGGRNFKEGRDGREVRERKDKWNGQYQKRIMRKRKNKV